MISPGEKFNAFGGHRLSKKDDAQTFEIGKRYVISANKNAVYTFFHLVNRTVTNVPWVFWLQLIMTFIHLALAVTCPLCRSIYEVNPGLYKVTNIFVIIVRYVPLDTSKVAEIALFVVYGIIDVGIFTFAVIIINFIKRRKEVSKYIVVYFYLNSLYLPLFRTSMTCIFSEMLRTFFLEYSFGNFFLLLVALFFLILHFGNIAFFSFAMGTSPSPNLKNPLAIWCPDVLKVVSYDFFIVFNFVILSITRSLKPKQFAIALACYLVIFLIPFFIYQARVMYYISFFAYEFIFVITLATCIFEVVIIIYCILQFKISIAVGIVVWLSFPMVINIATHSFIQGIVKRNVNNLNRCKPMTPIEGENAAEITDDLITSYESLGIKSANQAIRIARIGCLFSHPCFMDLSLIQFLIQNFQGALFEFLHLSFLLPDQSLFVSNLMDNFIDNKKPSIVQEAIMFQIVTSQSESSAELSPSLIREISFQNLQAMKSQQILQKIWSACYKGDITAMSKHAFQLEAIIKSLNKKWTYLALRYPFSTPILKEYIKFLKTTGCQHAKADAICNANPKLEDTTVTIDNEINMNILKQAVEEATDRRPIVTILKMNSILGVSVILTNIILIAVVIAGFIIFEMVNSSVDLISQAGICSEYLTQAPNNFAEIAEIESQPMTEKEKAMRDELYLFTKKMVDAYNVMMDQIPDDALRKQMNADHLEQFNFFMDNYSELSNTSLIDMLSQMVYFENALSYVPSNDTLNKYIRVNIDTATDITSQTISDIYTENSDLSRKVTISSYIFYVIIWSLTLFVGTPLFFVTMSGLKDELAYLFSLYSTMTRSTISKFLDGNTTMRRTTDHRSLSVMLTSTVTNNSRSNADFSNDNVDEEQRQINVADTFKVLVNDSDHSSTVLPPRFPAKAMFVYCSMTFLPMIVCTIMFLIIDFNTREIVRCLYTIDLISQRTYKCSLVLYHLNHENPNFTNVDSAIEEATAAHSSLLFASRNSKISLKIFDSDVFQNAHFSQPCKDPNEIKCKSLSAIFDDFISDARNKSDDHSGLGNSPHDIEIRKTFNSILFPRMDQLLTDVYEYTSDKVRFNKILLIIILIIDYFLTTILFFAFALPVKVTATATVNSVKLPLKFIDPIDLSDQQKLMQYLQGECDYGTQKFNEQSKGAPSGAAFLNIMTVPFAVFESDLSLLFANNAFYTLLSTSREATIGLPLDEIFSHVLPYKQNEDHPFNSLLEYIQQLARGVAAQNFIEIMTNIEIREKTKFPVMIRLIGVNDEKKSHNQEEENDEGKNFRATKFIVHITNLSHKKELEEKLKFESNISASLLEYAITKKLMRSLTDQDNTVPRTFHKKPLLSFTVKATSDDDANDDVLQGCSLFLRTAKDILGSFSSVTYLCHDAPTWYYMGGLDQEGDDVKIGLEEIIQCSLSILEVFAQSIANTSATLSAVIHFGEFTIIPLIMEYPRIEVAGPDFLKVAALSEQGQRGKVFLTEEAQEHVKEMKHLAFHKHNEKIAGQTVYIVDKLAEPGSTNDEFTIK